MALQAGKRLLPQLFAPAAATYTSPWVAAALGTCQADGNTVTYRDVIGSTFDHLHVGGMREDAQQPASNSNFSIPSLMTQHPGLLLQRTGRMGRGGLLGMSAGLLSPHSSTFSTRGISHMALQRQPLDLGSLTGLKAPPLMSRQSMPSFSPSRSYMTEGQLLGHAYLLATDIMFWTGLIGAVVFRRNLIVMLLATEIVMLACNLNFLFGSAYLNDMTGVIMSLTITTIAACETAIGLALCVTYFHMRSATDVEALNFLK